MLVQGWFAGKVSIFRAAKIYPPGSKKTGRTGKIPEPAGPTVDWKKITS
jgi:hypothetical protein